MDIRIPVGIENFAQIREDNYYYVDKTAFIRTFLNQRYEATLITRPRRFGKTLLMSMLEDFFDIRRESRAHFEGLEIAAEPALCKEWMNQWPVVFLSLKDIEGLTFQDAYGMLGVLLAELYKKYTFLCDSERVDAADKVIFKEIQYQQSNKENLKSSLLLLTRMLAAHYQKPAILLVDEYDVPLAKANEHHYDTEMMDLVRALLGRVLKTNPYLKFAIVTGCLRISKESIFTGINNMVTDSITKDGFSEYIGFTSDDVNRLLADTGFTARAADVKEWYDGYRFGRTEMYCPWDVLSFIRELYQNPNARPDNYWGNTSHNAVIRQFIDRKDLRDNENINEDMEQLIAGHSIYKEIREDLTYDTLDSSSQNLWSLLLLTGYLTIDVSAPCDGQQIALRIPNEEVRTLFRSTVQEWFTAKVKSEERTALFEALWSRDEQRSAKQLSDMVYDTISCYDYREDFYRAFMVGILSYAGYALITNKELGEGRPDIVLKDERNDRAMVIELKWTAKKNQMVAKCCEALEQIRDRRYADGLESEYDEVIRCGICFFKKQCMVKIE